MKVRSKRNLKRPERVLKSRQDALARGDYLSPQDRKITVADLWAGLVKDYTKNQQDAAKESEGKKSGSEVKQLEYKLRLKAAFGKCASDTNDH